MDFFNFLDFQFSFLCLVSLSSDLNMGRDKGKGKGGGRGGGRKLFIANVEELAIRDREVNELQDARIKRRAGSDEESGDDNKKDEDDDHEVRDVKHGFLSVLLCLRCYRSQQQKMSLHLTETPNKTVMFPNQDRKVSWRVIP